MKNLAIGCTSAILGLLIGVGLTWGALALVPKTESAEKFAVAVSATRGDVTITVSAKYLNAQLQQIVQQTGWAKQATLTLSAPNLAQLNLALETKILGRTITGSAVARVRVAAQNGRVALTVEKVDVSGIGVSQSAVAPIVEQVRAQTEDQINRALQRELQGTGLRLSNIRITSSEIAMDLVSQ